MRGGSLESKQDLAYDMVLEVQGLIRSLAVRTRLEQELQVGETFSVRGRRWVVSRVDSVSKGGVDRRVIAREVEAPEIDPVAA